MSRRKAFFGSVGEMTSEPCRTSTVAGATEGKPLMIRPLGSIQAVWIAGPAMRLARSGPLSGALGRQQSALARRRRLQAQLQQLKGGAVDYHARPPYPFRPRPPS